MDFLNTVVEQIALYGDKGTIGSPVIALTLVFASVFLAIVAVYRIWTVREAYQNRLKGAPQGGGSVKGSGGGSSLRYADEGMLLRVTASLQKHIVPSSEALNSKIRRRLVQAGYMNPSAVRTYFTFRFILGLGLPIVFGLSAPLFSHALNLSQILIIGAALAAVGLLLPSIVVALRVRRRQRDIREGFPDALDMLLVSVEAGLGLDAALNRVSDEIGRVHPVLSEQLHLTSLELRAGKSREDSLRNLADRVGIDEVRSLTTLLVQSERLGSSVAQTLRVHADEMRNKRVMRAEEKAHSLPVKLAIPLVLCILPSLLIILLSPGIIRMARILIPILKKGVTQME
jgi:tight adherence protein C